MEPQVEALAKGVGSWAKVARFSVERNGKFLLSKTVKDYAVRSIPAVFVIRNGEVVGQAVGGQSKETLKQMLEAARAPLSR